jgi:hypothetical protein
MELTVGQEADIQKIVDEIDCPKSFPCYESKFEDLTPVKAFSGTDVIKCLREKESHCSKSFKFKFGFNAIFAISLCKCPLRKYVALELGR